MKTLSLFIILFIATLEAHAAGCSNGVRKDFIDGVMSAVYNKEAVVSKDAALELVPIKAEASAYPAVTDVSDCLAAHAIEAAFPKCEDIFLKAAEFAAAVKAGKVTISDSSSGGGGDLAKLAEAGLTAPLEVYNYYKSYPGPTLNGGYFFGSKDLVLLIDADKDGVDDNEERGGFKEMFNKLASITQKCNTAAGVPTYVDPAIDEGDVTELAVLDVYNGSAISCSFVVQVINGEVRFEVTDPKLRACVEKSTAMIANIEKIEQTDPLDPSTRKLVTRRALAPTGDFISEVSAAPVRVSASEDDVESIDSIIDALDTGATGIDLGSAAAVKPNQINFLKIETLDALIMDQIFYCEYGGEPGNSVDKNAFLELWNSGDPSLPISPDNSWSINKANYYWSLYAIAQQNILLYPWLKARHEEFKAGLITPDDLWNWKEGAAYTMCYFNYPTYWIPTKVFDYMK